MLNGKTVSDNTIIDANVPLPNAFIKLGKMNYMKKYIEEGALRFSPASEFCNMTYNGDKISDIYEGSLFYPITHIIAAPLLSENGNEAVYGRPFKVANKGMERITFSAIQQIPFHCLYSYFDSPINAVIRLENYSQISREFPEYDAAVIIIEPLNFLKRLEKHYEIYANYVKYTDNTPPIDELDNQIHCLYYKRKEYSEQKEFRVSLPQLRITKSKTYIIGSLQDIAYCLPLKWLEKGVIIADSDANYQKVKSNCEQKGFTVGEKMVLNNG